jgi:hypothetical protein
LIYHGVSHLLFTPLVGILLAQMCGENEGNEKIGRRRVENHVKHAAHMCYLRFQMHRHLIIGRHCLQTSGKICGLCGFVLSPIYPTNGDSYVTRVQWDTHMH